MMKRKYRGKYTNARDCRHADNTEGLMAAVEVKRTCPHYGKIAHNLVPVDYCQRACKDYERIQPAGSGT